MIVAGKCNDLTIKDDDCYLLFVITGNPNIYVIIMIYINYMRGTHSHDHEKYLHYPNQFLMIVNKENPKKQI